MTDQVRAAPGAAPSVSPYAWYVLSVLVVVNVFNFIDRQILSILLESIRTDLNLTDTQLGFLTGIAFALFYAVFGLPLARLADRWSRRNVLALCLTAWSGMTAVCGLAQSYPQLMAARTAVAVGEAGCSPASHSLLSGLFPHAWRGRALAIHSMGLPLGILVGLALGGWVNEHFGWRQAFMVVGLPGIGLALLLFLTVREPPAPASETTTKVSTWSVFTYLWRLRTFRRLAIASSLNAFAGYGVLQWNPAFFIRTHGMGTAELGLQLGLITGISGGLGAFLGGFIADRLGGRDARWYVWLPAIAMAMSTPFYLGIYLAPTAAMAMGFFVIPNLFAYAYLGPVYASVQSLAPTHMRATASALLLFLMNIIGLGLGPQAVGIASDLLKPSFGSDSLRWALCFVVLAKAWAALHYWQAGKTLRAELSGS